MQPSVQNPRAVEPIATEPTITVATVLIGNSCKYNLERLRDYIADTVIARVPYTFRATRMVQVPHRRYDQLTKRVFWWQPHQPDSIPYTVNVSSLAASERTARLPLESSIKIPGAAMILVVLAASASSQ